MPSFPLNTSSSDQYDADGCDSGKRSKANNKGHRFLHSIAAFSARRLFFAPRPTERVWRRLSCTSIVSLSRDVFFSSITSSISPGGKLLQSRKECFLDLAKLEESSEQKRISVTSSELKLKEEVVIPHKSPNVKCNRRTPAASKQKSDTPAKSDAPMAPYPPQQLKPPSKCPVGAILHPLPLRLFDGELDSNQPSATLTKLKEPSSYTQLPPISPGIAHMSKDHLSDSHGITLVRKEQYAEEELSPTPSTSMQPLSVDEELVSPCKITEASYTSMNDRKKEKQVALRRARQWHVHRKRAAAETRAPAPRGMSKDERLAARARALQWAENRRSANATAGGLAHDELVVGSCSEDALKRSENNNARDLMKFGIVFQSLGKQLYPGLRARPDGDITVSLFSAINWENDERGHISYPAKRESQRMKDVNSRRPKKRGKVWIRQHPVTLRSSSVQTAQNKHVARWLRYYITTDLGQREDEAGGRRIILFVGYKNENSHVLEARKAKAKGYWDEVRFVDCKEESHQHGSSVEKSNQEGIRSPLSHAATAGGRDPPTLLTQTPAATATLSLLPPHAHFGGVAYEKDDDCSFPVLHPHAISMPTGRIH